MLFSWIILQRKNIVCFRGEKYLSNGKNIPWAFLRIISRLTNDLKWLKNWANHLKYGQSENNMSSYILVGCPQTIVSGASSALTATTSNTPQTITCSSGNFPSGFTSQQFICSTATHLWLPNPVITTCSSGTLKTCQTYCG